MKKLILVALLGMSVAVTGCAVTNGSTRVQNADVSFVQKGKTTKSELIEHLGEPTEVKVSSGGKETLIWEFYKSTSDAATFIPFIGMKAGTTTQETTTITASMDSRGRVADFSRATGRKQGGGSLGD